MASLVSCAIVSLGKIGKFVASQNGFRSEAIPKTEIYLCCEDQDWSGTEAALQVFVCVPVLVELEFSGLLQVRLVADSEFQD